MRKILNILTIIFLISCIDDTKETNTLSSSTIDKFTEDYLLKRAIDFHQASLDGDNKKYISFYDEEEFKSGYSKEDWLKDMERFESFWDKINIFKNVFKKRIRAEEDATFQILEFSKDKATIKITSKTSERYLGVATFNQFWVFKNNEWYISYQGPSYNNKDF